MSHWSAAAFAAFLLVSVMALGQKIGHQRFDELRLEVTQLLKEKSDIDKLPAAEQVRRLKDWLDQIDDVEVKFAPELEELLTQAGSQKLIDAKEAADEKAAQARILKRMAQLDARAFQILSQGNPAAYDVTIVKRFQKARTVIGAGAKGAIWSHPEGKFECLGQNRWVETGNKFTHNFTEIENTGNYIELVRPVNRQETRFVIVRLYEDRCWVKQPRDVTFSEYYQGGWSKP